MKSAKWMALAGVAVMGLATASSWGQADRDTKIIGAYVGAVTSHEIYGSSAGALFGFSLGYNNQGYHQGGLSTGSLFWNGRRYSLTLQLTVPPFPPSSRDIDFYMSALASDMAVTWQMYGTLPWGKFSEAYLRDTKVCYQATTLVPEMIFLSGGGILADTVPVIEAGRVSTQVFRAPTSATRIRIRR